MSLFPKYPSYPSLGQHRNHCSEQRMFSRCEDPTGTPVVWGWALEPVGHPNLCPEPARRRRWLGRGNCLGGREGGRATGCPSTEPPSPANQRLRVSQRFPAGPTMTSLFPSSTAATDLKTQQPRGKEGGRGAACSSSLLHPGSSWAVLRIRLEPETQKQGQVEQGRK